MKYLFPFLILIGLGMVARVEACDVCGSSGTGGVGLLSLDNKTFTGLRYTYRSAVTNHPPSIIPGQSRGTALQYLHTAEVWGQWSPGKKWRLFGFLPWNYFISQEEGERTVPVNDLGDAYALISYQIIGKYSQKEGAASHQLLVSGGIKAPTGKYENFENNNTFNPMSPGTGSWDFLTALSYHARFGNWGKTRFGTLAEQFVKLNTANSSDYRFGHRSVSSARFYTMHPFGTWNGMLGAGGSFELAGKDVDQAFEVFYSGGYVAYASLSLDVEWKQIGFGGLASFPITQYVSEGIVENNMRIQSYFIFKF